MITREELARIMPFAKLRGDIFLSPLNETMGEYEIIGGLRIAAFLAQLAVESGELRYVEEIADGSAYEGRKDLGNCEVGDGCRFKGRGLIQITGRANYERCSHDLFGDGRLLEEPEILESPIWAARSAGWYWDSRHLNTLADQKDFRGITKRVNGGYNGYQTRLSYYNRALMVLGEES